MNGSLRERQKADRRMRMVSAALELFDRHGFGGVSVEQIAERIQLSYRTVYRYFPAKEDLVLAVPVEVNHAFLDRVQQRLGDAPLLETFSAAMSEVLAEAVDRVGEDVFRIVHEQIDREPSVRARALLHSADMQDRLVSVVCARLGYGPEREPQAHLAAAVFSGVSAVAQRRWRKAGGEVGLAAAYREALAGLPALVRA